MGLSLLISFGVSKLFEGIDNLVHAEEKAQEKAKERADALKQEADQAAQALEEQKSKVEDLNGQLEETQSRLSELKSLGHLTITEQSELEQLQATNDELEKRLRLEKAAEEVAKKENEAALEKKFTSSDTQNDDGKNYKHTEEYLAIKGYELTREYLKRQQIKASASPGALAKIQDSLKELNAFEEANVSFEDYRKHANNVVDTDTVLKEMNEDISFEEYLSDLRDAYKLNPTKYKDELTAAAITFQKDYLDQVTEAFAKVKGWDDLYDQIQEALFPSETKNEKLDALINNLSKQTQAKFNILAQQGALGADDLSDAFVEQLKANGFTTADAVEQLYSRARDKAEVGSKELSEIFNSDSDDNALTKFLENIEKVKEALNSLATGDLSKDDVLSLMKELEIGYEEVDLASDGYDGLREALLKVADDGYDKLVNAVGDFNQYSDPRAIKQYIKSLEDMKNEAKETANAINSVNNAISGLNKISSAMDTLDSAYQKLKEGEGIEFDDLVNLQEAFGDKESWANFAKLLTNNKSMTDEVQAAFDELVTEFINESDLWDNVDAENAEIYKVWLDRFGIDAKDTTLENAVKQSGLSHNAQQLADAITNDFDVSFQTAMEKAGYSVDDTVTDLYNKIVSGEIDVKAIKSGDYDEQLEQFDISSKDTEDEIKQFIENLIDTVSLGYKEVNTEILKGTAEALKNADITDEDRQSLLGLAEQMREINNVQINTKDDVQAILELYQAVDRFTDINTEDFADKIQNIFTADLSGIEQQFSDYFKDHPAKSSTDADAIRVIRSQYEQMMELAKASELNTYNIRDFDKALGVLGSSANASDEQLQGLIDSMQKSTSSILAESAALLENETLADADKEALARLLLEKNELTNITIDNQDDLDYLMDIAVKAGIATEKLGKYYKLKRAYELRDEYENSKDKNKYNSRFANSEYLDALTTIYQLESDVIGSEVDLDWSSLFPTREDFKVGIDFSDSKLGYDGNDKSNEDAEDSLQTIDWVEIKLQRLQESIDRLDNKASDTWRSWSNRNKNLGKEISEVTDNINAQEKAYSTYIAKANSIALSEDLKTKVRRGDYSITDYDGDTADLINEYQTWYEKAIACSDAVEENKDRLAELAQTKFDNISKQFEDQIALIEHEISLIDELINYETTDGHFVSKSYYDDIKAQTKAEIKKTEAERDALIKQRDSAVADGTIKKGSEQWNAMTQQINEATLSVAQLNTKLLETDNNIRQLEWDAFDWFADSVNNVISESDFLNGLFDENKMFKKNGAWRKSAQSSSGLHVINYNAYTEQAEYYGKEIEKVNKDLAKDPTDKELINRKNALVKAQQDAINNAHKEKDAVVDLYRKGYEKMINRIKELSTAYMDALNAEKDMFDYEKTIKDKTDNIVSLRKQLQAFSGDDSEETQARIQKLKVDLQNAEDDLEQTEYDRWRSDQQKMLDTFQTDAQEWVDERLSNIETLFQEQVQATTDSAESISKTITDAAEKSGYTLSEDLGRVLTSAIDSRSVDAYQNSVTETMALMYDRVNAMAGGILSLSNQKGRTDTSNSKKKTTKKQSTTNDKKKTTTTTDKKKTTTTTDNPSVKVGSSIKVKSGTKAHWSASGSQDSAHPPVGTSTSKSYKIASVNKGSKYPYLLEGLGWISLEDIVGYKTGGKNIKDEWAWTQENGGEIIRTKDGGILTPVKGATVFNNAQTEALWNFSKALTSGISASAKIPDEIKNSHNEVGGSVIFSGDIYVKANNPTEFTEQLANALKNDTKIQKMLLANTIDLAAGKNSLSIRKY